MKMRCAMRYKKIAAFVTAAALLLSGCSGLSEKRNLTYTDTLYDTVISVQILDPAKEEVLKLLDSHIELYHAYCRILNEKLDFLLSRVNLLSVKSNRKRLAAYLLQSDGVSISSRQELADYLALGKSALFRELGWLRDAGAIRWEGACIEVIDKEKLLEVLNA